jgi:hypothetical protein
MNTSIPSPAAPPPPAPGTPRREFLRTAARCATLAGFGALVASALVRQAPPAGGVCPGSGVCRRCALATGCVRPRSAGADPRPLPSGKPSLP